MTRSQSPLFNIFHYQIGNDGGYWTIRWTDVSPAGFAVVSYIRGVTEPTKIFGLATMLKLLKSLFRHWRVFSLNLRIVYRGSNEPTLFIPSIQRLRTRMYRTNQTSVWYSFKGAPMQKPVFLCKNKNLALSEHFCQTNHTIGWNNCEIINRDDGGLLPDTYLHLISECTCTKGVA